MTNQLEGGLVHDLPADFSDALVADASVVERWQSLTPIARNEFICWIEDAKKQQTRSKRISRAVDELQVGKKRPCCWPGCIPRTDKQPRLQKNKSNTLK